MRHTPALLLLLPLALGLSACEQVGNQLGIETPALAASKREADAKATGGACRHAGRAIEDCYNLNPRAERAAVYTGWREMNEYMRENKIEPVAPVVPPPPPEPTEAEKKAAAKAAKAAKAEEAASRAAAAAAAAAAAEDGAEAGDAEVPATGKAHAAPAKH